MAYEKKDGEIGALWVRSSAKGDYMTGAIDLGDGPVKVVCFAVNNQSNDKAPTWRVLKSKPREESTPF